MNPIFTATGNFLSALRTWTGWSMVVAIGVVIAGRYPQVHDAVGSLSDIVGAIAAGLSMIGHGTSVKKADKAQETVQGMVDEQDRVFTRLQPRGTTTVGLLLVLLVPFFGACSNLTPNQVLRTDTALYVVADVGATAAVQAHKIPASEVPAVQEDLGLAKRNLDALRGWVVANPNLANVVGMTPPELTATEAAIEVISRLILKYSLLSPLPPLTVPDTTQSAIQPSPQL